MLVFLRSQGWWSLQCWLTLVHLRNWLSNQTQRRYSQICNTICCFLFIMIWPSNIRCNSSVSCWKISANLICFPGGRDLHLVLIAPVQFPEPRLHKLPYRWQVRIHPSSVSEREASGVGSDCSCTGQHSETHYTSIQLCYWGVQCLNTFSCVANVNNKWKISFTSSDL